MTTLNLFGQTKEQLQELCNNEGFPRYVAQQLCDWLYANHCEEIDQMTNLSLKTRARLNEIATIKHWTPVNCQVSKDGTKKYLCPAEDGQFIETVFLPE